MTDDATGIALWDDNAGLDARELPIPDELRERIRDWVDQFTETVGGTNQGWRHPELLEHDRRGYQLSLDLQSALGPRYRVEYVFETQDLRHEAR
jgi:hypothetical protein